VQQKRFRFIIVGLIAIVIMLQGLTFRIFHSSFCTDNPIIALYGLEGTYSNDCEWGTGASVTILSMLAWFVAIVLLMLIEPLKETDEETIDGAYRIQTETSTEVVQPTRPAVQLA
jgi:uncharacterized membrane protein